MIEPRALSLAGIEVRENPVLPEGCCALWDGRGDLVYCGPLDGLDGEALRVWAVDMDPAMKALLDAALKAGVTRMALGLP